MVGRALVGIKPDDHQGQAVSRSQGAGEVTRQSGEKRTEGAGGEVKCQGAASP